MTYDEENALSAFLQALALSIANFLDQVPPEDRTSKNFLLALDGNLGEILSDSTASNPTVQAGSRELQAVLLREIERMPLARLMEDDSRH